MFFYKLCWLFLNKEMCHYISESYSSVAEWYLSFGLVSSTVQWVVRIGPPKTSVALCGLQPTGGPWNVLHEPDQTTRHGELQHTCLWINLDYRGVDGGEQAPSVNTDTTSWMQSENPLSSSAQSAVAKATTSVSSPAVRFMWRMTTMSTATSLCPTALEPPRRGTCPVIWASAHRHRSGGQETGDRWVSLCSWILSSQFQS